MFVHLKKFSLIALLAAGVVSSAAALGVSGNGPAGAASAAKAGKITPEAPAPGASAPSLDTSELNASQAGAAQPEQSPPVTLYISIAASPLTSALWVSSGYDSREHAHGAALDACSKALGAKAACSVIDGSGAEHFVFVINEEGNLYWSSSPDSEKDARRQAMNLCHKSSLSCQRLRSIKNSPTQADDFPSEPLPKKIFAVIARPRNALPASSKWLNTGWLAINTDQDGYAAASQAATAACAKDSGQRCRVYSSTSALSTGNDLLVRFISAADEEHILTYWRILPSLKSAATYAGRRRPAWIAIDSMPANNTLVQTFALRGSAQPLRGYFAIAVPLQSEEAHKWAHVAVQTHQASLEQAQEKALRSCQDLSHASCQVISKDDGLSPYALVYSFMGITQVQPMFNGQAAFEWLKKTCSKSNKVCTPNKLIDLRKPQDGAVAI